MAVNTVTPTRRTATRGKTRQIPVQRIALPDAKSLDELYETFDRPGSQELALISSLERMTFADFTLRDFRRTAEREIVWTGKGWTVMAGVRIRSGVLVLEDISLTLTSSGRTPIVYTGSIISEMVTKYMVVALAIIASRSTRLPAGFTVGEPNSSFVNADGTHARALVFNCRSLYVRTLEWRGTFIEGANLHILQLLAHEAYNRVTIR